MSNKTINSFFHETKSKENKKLSNIWDDPHIEKIKNGWKCLWCGNEWETLNATCDLIHVSHIRVNGTTGINFCNTSIPDENKKKYVELAEKKMKFIKEKLNINFNDSHRFSAIKRMFLI